MTFGPVAPHCFAVVCFSMTVGCVAVGADSVAWVGDSVAADCIAFAADYLPVCHDSIFADYVIEKTDYVGLTAYCGCGRRCCRLFCLDGLFCTIGGLFA